MPILPPTVSLQLGKALKLTKHKFMQLRFFKFERQPLPFQSTGATFRITMKHPTNNPPSPIQA